MPREPAISVRILAAERCPVGTWWRFRGLRSPFARIYLVHGGSATLTIDGAVHRLRPARLALVAGGVRCDYHCPVAMDHSYCCALLSGPGGLDPWPLLPHHVTVPSADGDTAVFARLAVLAGPLPAGDPLFGAERGATGLAAAVEAGALVRLLLARFLRDAPASAPTGAARFAPVVAAVDAQLARPPSPAALARLAGLRVSWFGARFRAIFGLPPAAWIRRRRLEVAEMRLATSDVPVKRIAAELGFSRATHFVRAFRRHAGVTPGRYRALQQGVGGTETG